MVKYFDYSCLLPLTCGSCDAHIFRRWCWCCCGGWCNALLRTSHQRRKMVRSFSSSINLIIKTVRHQRTEWIVNVSVYAELCATAIAHRVHENSEIISIYYYTLLCSVHSHLVRIAERVCAIHGRSYMYYAHASPAQERCRMWIQ